MGTLSDSVGFQKAFQCPAGSVMNRGAQRCQLWGLMLCYRPRAGVNFANSLHRFLLHPCGWGQRGWRPARGLARCLLCKHQGGLPARPGVQLILKISGRTSLHPHLASPRLALPSPHLAEVRPGARDPNGGGARVRPITLTVLVESCIPSMNHAHYHDPRTGRKNPSTIQKTQRSLSRFLVDPPSPHHPRRTREQQALRRRQGQLRPGTQQVNELQFRCQCTRLLHAVPAAHSTMLAASRSEIPPPAT